MINFVPPTRFRTTLVKSTGPNSRETFLEHFSVSYLTFEGSTNIHYNIVTLTEQLASLIKYGYNKTARHEKYSLTFLHSFLVYNSYAKRFSTTRKLKIVQISSRSCREA